MGLEEAVQTLAGHGLVLALFRPHLLPLLSQDIKGDLLQLIYKGPGWASATERNNYSQLLPICPTVCNSTWAVDANCRIQMDTNMSANTTNVQHSPHQMANQLVLLTLGQSMSCLKCLYYLEQRFITWKTSRRQKGNSIGPLGQCRVFDGSSSYGKKNKQSEFWHNPRIHPFLSIWSMLFKC